MKNRTVKKITRIRGIMTFAFVLIFGIAFLTLFVVLNKDIPENYIETSAKIIRIEEELSPVYDATDGIGPEDYEHRVFVEYSHGGKTYSDVEYTRYDSDMKEGDTVLLYLNPDDPAEFMGDPSGDFAFVIAGSVVVLIGAGGLAYQFWQIKKEKEI